MHRSLHDAFFVVRSAFFLYDILRVNHTQSGTYYDMFSVSPVRMLIACGLCQVVCYAALVALGPLNHAVSAFFILWLLIIGFYSVAVIVVLGSARTAESRASGSRTVLSALFAFAVIFRLLMWFSPPSLSDDVYRNVWEGRMLVAGVNPFQYAPDDPHLIAHRDADIYPHINHPQYPAIYPPVSQFVFGIAARLHPSTGALKAVLALFDLGTAAVLLLILRVLGMPGRRCIVYAWHPLPVIEFAGSGHCDSIGIFFLMLFILCALRSLHYAGAAALAMSALAKLYAALLLPCVLARRPAALMLFAVCVVLACLPFTDAGGDLFFSLGIYARDWHFNGSIYDLLALCLPDGTTARIAAALLFAVFYGFVAVRCMRSASACTGRDLMRTAFYILGFFLLLSPVLYPWYLCWILPFLAVFLNRAWLYLSAAVVVSYQVLIGYTEAGVWQEQLWVRLLQYVPFYALLLYGSLRTLAAARAGGCRG